jgi:hypothetical protein
METIHELSLQGVFNTPVLLIASLRRMPPLYQPFPLLVSSSPHLFNSQSVDASILSANNDHSV